MASNYDLPESPRPLVPIATGQTCQSNISEKSIAARASQHSDLQQNVRHVTQQDSFERQDCRLDDLFSEHIVIDESAGVKQQDGTPVNNKGPTGQDTAATGNVYTVDNEQIEYSTEKEVVSNEYASNGHGHDTMTSYVGNIIHPNLSSGQTFNPDPNVVLWNQQTSAMQHRNSEDPTAWNEEHSLDASDNIDHSNGQQFMTRQRHMGPHPGQEILPMDVIAPQPQSSKFFQLHGMDPRVNSAGQHFVEGNSHYQYQCQQFGKSQAVFVSLFVYFLYAAQFFKVETRTNWDAGPSQNQHLVHAQIPAQGPNMCQGRQHPDRNLGYNQGFYNPQTMAASYHQYDSSPGSEISHYPAQVYVQGQANTSRHQMHRGQQMPIPGQTEADLGGYNQRIFYQGQPEAGPSGHNQRVAHHNMLQEQYPIGFESCNQYAYSDEQGEANWGGRSRIDSRSVEEFSEVQGSPGSDHQNRARSPVENQMFVPEDDDAEHETTIDDDELDEEASRRHGWKGKVPARASERYLNPTHRDFDKQNYKVSKGFQVPPTASSYQPSRFSGIPIPKTAVSQQPRLVSANSVSDATLKKRGLHKNGLKMVPKRAGGLNDPENIMIVNMYDNKNLSYAEIAKTINKRRLDAGKATMLSENAVMGRYARTAPALYEAEGKTYVPPAKRKGARFAVDTSEWTSELDSKLVDIVKETESTLWNKVTDAFNRETGRNMTREQIARRYACF